MLTQTEPIRRPLVEDPSEVDLRALYPHPPGMVRLGMIEGSGGEATGPDGSSRSLSGPDDLRILRVLRAAADVVVVGAATALREHYGPIAVSDALAQARGPARSRAPVLAVVSHSGTLPPGLGPRSALLITTASAPAAALAPDWGSSLIVAGFDDVSPRLMVAALAQRGLDRILCEGGPSLAEIMLGHGVVTDYCLTTSPHDGDDDGPMAPEVPAGFRPIHTLEGEGFTMRRWGIPPG